MTARRVLEGREHGIRASYKAGCRCDACTEVQSAYNAARRAAAADVVEAEPVVVDVLRIPVCCPHCGGAVVQQAEGRPTSSGTRVSTVLRCSVAKCRRQWLVITVIQSLSGAEYLGAA